MTILNRRLVGHGCHPVLGVIWYSDTLFRKAWMRGFPGGSVTNDNRVYIASAAAMCSLAFFLDATLSSYFNINGVHEALHFAFIMTIPVALLQIPHTAFEGRSLRTYLVNVGFDCAELNIVCTMVTIL